LSLVESEVGQGLCCAKAIAGNDSRNNIKRQGEILGIAVFLEVQWIESICQLP